MIVLGSNRKVEVASRPQRWRPLLIAATLGLSTYLFACGPALPTPTSDIATTQAATPTPAATLMPAPPATVPSSSPAASTTAGPVTATTATAPSGLATVTVQPTTTIGMVQSVPTPGQAECPKLESRLYRLASANDPASYAANSGLDYREGKVRAIVELSALEGSVPSGYEIVIESRQGALVQVLALTRELCRLSNEAGVRFVRSPISPTR